MSYDQELIAGYIELFLFFGIIAIAVNLFAVRKDFFRLDVKGTEGAPLTFLQVLCVFGIYLGTSFILAPFIGKIIFRATNAALSESSAIAALGWLQLVVMCVAIFLLVLYCLFQKKSLIKAIWKSGPSSIYYDFGIGIMTWIISFPVVIALGQILDLLIYLFFGIVQYEQVAVRYLKMMIGSPSMLAIALFVSLFAAPVIEEFLFRGCLQNWFCKHVGVKAAILLSSLCFALFHFAPSQGIGNIPLVISLFAFALYLGFVYARQRSLFASIGLHITFNAVSVARLLFFPET